MGSRVIACPVLSALFGSPLGLGWRLSSVNEKTVIEPQRGSGMQPEGAAPGRGSLGNRVMPPRPGLRTASRSRQRRGEVAGTCDQVGSEDHFGPNFDQASEDVSEARDDPSDFERFTILPEDEVFHFGIDDQLERLGKIDDAI